MIAKFEHEKIPPIPAHLEAEGLRLATMFKEPYYLVYAHDTERYKLRTIQAFLMDRDRGKAADQEPIVKITSFGTKSVIIDQDRFDVLLREALTEDAPASKFIARGEWSTSKGDDAPTEDAPASKFVARGEWSTSKGEL